MTETETYNANIRIRDLPRAADRLVDLLASYHGKLKWEIVRDAIVEYTERHKDEITK